MKKLQDFNALEFFLILSNSTQSQLPASVITSPSKDTPVHPGSYHQQTAAAEAP